VWAKIAGSIYGLRGLLAAVVLAWVVGLLCGALGAGAFAELLAQTLVIGGFMVAIGVAFSLHCESSTRAMTGTILSWLAEACVFAMLAGILTLMALLVWFIWSLLHTGLAAAPAPATWWPSVLFQCVRLAFYGLAALLIAVYIQRRFDRLAGRCTAAG
jgi:hypothetical protein